MKDIGNAVGNIIDNIEKNEKLVIYAEGLEKAAKDLTIREKMYVLAAKRKFNKAISLFQEVVIQVKQSEAGMSMDEDSE